MTSSWSFVFNFYNDARSNKYKICKSILIFYKKLCLFHNFISFLSHNTHIFLKSRIKSSVPTVVIQRLNVHTILLHLTALFLTIISFFSFDAETLWPSGSRFSRSPWFTRRPNKPWLTTFTRHSREAPCARRTWKKEAIIWTCTQSSSWLLCQLLGYKPNGPWGPITPGPPGSSKLGS